MPKPRAERNWPVVLFVLIVLAIAFVFGASLPSDVGLYGPLR